MSSASPSQEDRFVDLLMQRSTTGLSESEQQEFDNMAHSPNNQSEAERYDLTAAALDLSFGYQNQQSMPRDVQDRLLLAAGSFFSKVGKGAPTDAVELSPRRAANRFSWREAIAMAVTAACLMLMLSGWNPFANPTSQPVSQPIAVVRPPTAAERMQQLTNSKPADLVQENWEPVLVKAASGQVVWSDTLQEGYMEFSGMRVNDPTVEQYQLWIFDTDKQQKYPVDGGVFDITSTGEVVVPIKPNIPVDKAVQFAITIERPGGVVVSQRERIPVLASLD